MAGQKRSQVLAHANGANARSAASMRNAKSLVQVEVGNISAEFTRGRTADQGIEIGAVQINRLLRRPRVSRGR